MSIRKYKRKLVLCVAAFFWAGCDNDSSSAPEAISDNPGEITSSDSAEVIVPSSSSEEQTIPSSESSELQKKANFAAFP